MRTILFYPLPVLQLQIRLLIPGMDKKDLKDTNNMKDMPGMNKKDMNDMKDMSNMKGMKLIDASTPYDNNPATEKALSVKKNKQ